MPSQLDIVIPVYNEGPNIGSVLQALARDVRTPCRVLIVYDFSEDDTLPAILAARGDFPALPIECLRNAGRGAHAAVMTGFAHSDAPYIVMFPADDNFNAHILDHMIAEAEHGRDVVCASRFVEGGSMVGAPWLKAALVHTTSFTLHHLARLPAHDATSGFRLFTRRMIEDVVIESDRGFCYSIELLVKAHRLRWRVGEVPAQWYERTKGTSRFRLLRWLPSYLRWYFYAFATTYLQRPPSSVTMKADRAVRTTDVAHDAT